MAQQTMLHRPSAEEMVELQRRYRAGETQVLADLAEAYKGLIYKLACHHGATCNRGALDIEDLVQSAIVVGLRRAILGYNPARSRAFSTSLYQQVRKAIREQAAALSRPLKVSRWVDDTNEALVTARQVLAQRGVIAPTVEEIADEAKVSLGAAQKILGLQFKSLDGPLGLNLSADPRASDPASVVIKALLKQDLRYHLDQLDEKDRGILTELYGLDGQDRSTIRELATNLDVNEKTIMSWRNKALARLRRSLEAAGYEP